MAEGNQLPGLRRGLKIIEVLSGATEGMLFGDLQAAFPDLVPSTLTRVLKVLVDEAMVRYEPANRRYLLADRADSMADGIKGGLPAARRIQPVLDRLADATGLSAMFMEYRQGRIVIAAKTEPPDAFHYGEVGGEPRHPRHGMRRLCWAHLSPAERRAMDRAMNVPDGDPAPLKKQDVFISTRDDQPGLTRIGAPVYTAGGVFTGVIGVTFFQRFPAAKLKQIASVVRQHAQKALH